MENLQENKVELPENQVSMLAPFLEELEALPPTPNIVEQTQVEVDAERSSGINALWEAIRKRRDDSNVIDDANKENPRSNDSSNSSLEHYMPESHNVGTQQAIIENPEIKIFIEDTGHKRHSNFKLIKINKSILYLRI